MSDLIIHGLPLSSYVRTARMIAALKGVPFVFDQVDFRSDAYLELHPFRRIPAMTHGDVHLYETLAIGTYIDHAFDGAALQPAEPANLGRMFQWISVLNDYAYEQIVRRCVQERFVKPMRGLEADEARVAEAKPEIAKVLSVLDGELSDAAYLAGPDPSLAECFFAPVLVYFAATPEGKEMLPEAPNVMAWMKRMEAMPQFDEINKMG